MCRAFGEESKARMGVVECVTHKLLDPFDVLYDKEGIYYMLIGLSNYFIMLKIACYLQLLDCPIRCLVNLSQPWSVQC